jgi:phosphoribosyl-ATP pyrophosphohydrolase
MTIERLENYTLSALRTWNKQKSKHDRSMHAAIGIGAEGGEILNKLKKIYIEGKEVDRESLLEEYGDLLYYLLISIHEEGFSLSEVITMNRDKRIERYPEAFKND